MLTVIRVAKGALLGGALAILAADGVEAKNTFSGAYLAALHAAREGDVDAAAKYFSRALEREPGDLALMEQALIYETAAGRMDEALNLASRLSVFDAKHRMANLMLAADELKRGDFAAVLKRIEAEPEAFHPLLAGLFAGWAKAGVGDSDGAEAAFAGLTDQQIFRVFSAYHTGLMRHAAGDAEAAVTAFDKLSTELKAPTGRMARAYAAALIDAGQPEKAREIYEVAAAISVSDEKIREEMDALAEGEAPGPLVTAPAEGAAEALYGLAAALGREGDSRLSLVYARLAAWLRPDLHDATLLTAEILENSGQDEAAVTVYETIPPDSALARAAEIGRAEALFRLERKDEAAEALKALTRREPEAVDAQIALGDVLRRMERFREAAQAYDAAIKVLEKTEQANWALYYQRGIAHERSGAWALAEADFFKALEFQPDQPLVMNYLGYSWLEQGKNLDRAMEMIHKAVDQRPDDGYIVDSLGWGFYLREDFSSAVRELERAVELQPVDPVINDHYGDALWRVGRRREAEFQWRRALSFGPDEKTGARIGRKLSVGLDRVLEEEKATNAKAAPANSANDG